MEKSFAVKCAEVLSNSLDRLRAASGWAKDKLLSLLSGLRAGLSWAWEALKGLCRAVVEFFKSFGRSLAQARREAKLQRELRAVASTAAEAAVADEVAQACAA